MSVNKNKIHLIELLFDISLSNSEKEFLLNLVEDEEKIESEINSILEPQLSTRSEIRNCMNGIHTVIRNQINYVEAL